MDSDTLIKLIVLFILLLLSAFFSSSETTLTTVNPLRIKALVSEGNKKAAVLDSVLEHSGKMLSAVLIGNNVVNITASALATSIAIELAGGSESYIGYSTAILTVAVLIFGEILPKNISMHSGEKLAFFCCYPIRFLMIVLTPVIWLVNSFSSVILRLCGIRTDRPKQLLTEDDLLTYVEEGHAEGILEEAEHDFIKNVFDFGDAVAEDIMIPRIDIVSVGVDATYNELLKVFRNNMYTRIPVYEDDPDHMIGIVNIKDFLLVTGRKEFSVRHLLRETHYTYEKKKATDLFPEMRKESTGVTFVLDEYGKCVGMITMEDLLEEIVGEIRDEYDEDEVEQIMEEGIGTYLVDASIRLSDLNDEIHTSFDSENYDTIGGLVIEHLERIPKNGETIETEDGYTLKVCGVRNNRIQKIRIFFPKEAGEVLSETTTDM